MDKRGNRVAKDNREEASGKQLFEEWEGKEKPRKTQKPKPSSGVVRQGRGRGE
jgi:hypothetical protein